MSEKQNKKHTGNHLEDILESVHYVHSNALDIQKNNPTIDIPESQSKTERNKLRAKIDKQNKEKGIVSSSVKSIKASRHVISQIDGDTISYSNQRKLTEALQNATDANGNPLDVSLKVKNETLNDASSDQDIGEINSETKNNRFAIDREVKKYEANTEGIRLNQAAEQFLHYWYNQIHNNPRLQGAFGQLTNAETISSEIWFKKLMTALPYLYAAPLKTNRTDIKNARLGKASAYGVYHKNASKKAASRIAEIAEFYIANNPNSKFCDPKNLILEKNSPLYIDDKYDALNPENWTMPIDDLKTELELDESTRLAEAELKKLNEEDDQTS